MKYKIILSILAVFITSLFIFPATYAAPKIKCPRTSVFICREDVELLVLQTFQPLIEVVGKLAGQTEVQEERISDLEKKVAVLEARLTPSPTPTVIPTPTNDPQPFEVVFEINGGSGKASANELIETCQYTAGTGNVSITANGTINGFVCTAGGSTASPIKGMRVESYHGEVKVYGVMQ